MWVGSALPSPVPSARESAAAFRVSGLLGVGDEGHLLLVDRAHVRLQVRRRPALQRFEFRKVDVRLPGKGNSSSHGARPVHLIITMIKWIRTRRVLDLREQLEHPPLRMRRMSIRIVYTNLLQERVDKKLSTRIFTAHVNTKLSTRIYYKNTQPL